MKAAIAGHRAGDPDDLDRAAEALARIVPPLPDKYETREDLANCREALGAVIRYLQQRHTWHTLVGAPEPVAPYDGGGHES